MILSIGPRRNCWRSSNLGVGWRVDGGRRVACARMIARVSRLVQVRGPGTAK